MRFRTALASATLGLVTVSTTLQPQTGAVLTVGGVPDTPLGRHVEEFVAAFNTGDTTVIATFVDRNYQAEAVERRGRVYALAYWESVFQEVDPVAIPPVPPTTGPSDQQEVTHGALELPDIDKRA